MKNKNVLLIMLIGFCLLAVSGVAAGTLIPLNERAKEKGRMDNAPVMEEAGGDIALSAPGLEKIMFVRYKKGFVKPPKTGAAKKPKSQCYGFLARGLAWKELPITCVVHPDLMALTASDPISSAFETWDEAVGENLFSECMPDSAATWDGDKPDGRNEFVFEDYPEEGVIGVAVVWGYFSGPPAKREIIEFDVLFDTDFEWGNAAINSEVMDLQNIATHEIGHGLGLADMYESVCIEVTMYGYSGEGDIEKRTLEPADVKGLQKLYEN